MLEIGGAPELGTDVLVIVTTAGVVDVVCVGVSRGVVVGLGCGVGLCSGVGEVVLLC